MILIDQDDTESSSELSAIKPSPNREKSLHKDTIMFEQEKQQFIEPRKCSTSSNNSNSSSPQPPSQSSSTTPLLFGNTTQSYQQPQPVLEQLQQTSITTSPLLSTKTASFKDLYNESEEEQNNLKKSNDFIVVVNIDDELMLSKNESEDLSNCNTNPFLNSHSLSTVKADSCCVAETTEEVKSKPIQEIFATGIDTASPDQIRDREEVICPEITVTLTRSNSKTSSCSGNDNNSIEEALRELDNAIGIEEYDDDEEMDLEKDGILPQQQHPLDMLDLADLNLNSMQPDSLDVVEDARERATDIVNKVVHDCEEIIHEMMEKKCENAITTPAKIEDKNFYFNGKFECPDLITSTPCITRQNLEPLRGGNQAQTHLLFDEDSLDFIFEDEEAGGKTFDAMAVLEKVPAASDTFTFPENIETETKEQPVIGSSVPVPIIRVDKEKDKDENSSEDMTTVTPVNTPIEVNWDNMSNTGASPKQQPYEALEVNDKTTVILDKTQVLDKTVTLDKTVVLDKTVTLEKEENITFNTDGWYLHPNARNDTFDVEEENEMQLDNQEDLTNTFDQLRKQLAEMLPHAQGMNAHNEYLEDEILEK